MAVTDDDLAGLDFRHMVRDVSAGLVVKPILHNYLFDASFPEFSLLFPKQKMARAPDGWFHPSTHPTWTDRQLYYYLTQPELMLVEKLEYMSTLSVTVGTAMHGFIEMCLTDAGIRPLALQACTMCPPDRNCKEAGVMDEESRSRGHMDGVLDLAHLHHQFDEDQPVVEFKTTNSMKLRKFKDNDVEAYRKAWPEYYAQIQEYLRLSGKRMAVVLFMSMGYPWEMKEFHIPFDRAFANAVREKYLSVIDLAEKTKQPSYTRCCGKPKSCPARAVCSVVN